MQHFFVRYICYLSQEVMNLEQEHVDENMEGINELHENNPAQFGHMGVIAAEWWDDIVMHEIPNMYDLGTLHLTLSHSTVIPPTLIYY